MHNIKQRPAKPIVWKLFGCLGKKEKRNNKNILQWILGLV
jgi:hypothetical protein